MRLETRYWYRVYTFTLLLIFQYSTSVFLLHSIFSVSILHSVVQLAFFLNNSSYKAHFDFEMQLTIADLALFNAWNLLELCEEIAILELLAKNKHVKAHYEKIGAIEKVKAWIESRPKTDF